MKVLLNTLLILTFLVLSRVSIATPGELEWEDYYDREGKMDDRAMAVAEGNGKVFVAGWTYTKDGGFAFTVRAYNASSGALVWENYYNRDGALDDRAIALATSSGKVFVAGWTLTSTGGFAFSVRAYDAANGALLWSNYYDREGSLQDVANAVAAGGGKVFVAGKSQTATGGFAFSVRAYNANDGSFLWGDYYDRERTKDDTANAVAVSGGKVFVTGWTQTKIGGYAFTVRAYDADDGTLLWEDYYDREGKREDWASAIAASGGRVFAVGRTRTKIGGYALAVRAYDATNGNLLWEDHYDREKKGEDAANAVAVNNNKVFVVGKTETKAGGFAFTVRAYDATNGTLLWSDYYDREKSKEDVAQTVAIGDNKVFVGGWCYTKSGGYAFTVRVHNATDGTLLWENYYDKEKKYEDWVNAIAVDDDEVFAAGVTRTKNGDTAFSVRTFED